jgi:hypothetical protein
MEIQSTSPDTNDGIQQTLPKLTYAFKRSDRHVNQYGAERTYTSGMTPATNEQDSGDF